MILILAGEADEQARTLAERWHAAVVTPTDLSKAGWRYELPERYEAVAVATGRLVRRSEITGVLTRLPFVRAADLPGIAGEDRAFVATEMQSFLAAWLDSLHCPVLNRPTPNCLCGQSSRVPFLSAGEGDHTVVVAGDRCIGATDSRQQERALAVAREAGVQLIAVNFREGEFVNASLVPDLSTDEAADAVYQLLTSPRVQSRAPRFRVPPSSPKAGAPILLWGLPADGPLSRVYEELLSINAPVRLLDQRDVLETKIDEKTAPGRVDIRGDSFMLSDIGSVYLRCYDSTQIPCVLEAPEEMRRHATEVDSSIMRWIETTSAFVVNPLDAMAVNNSKPYQSRWIAQLGWRIPDTLITTDPAAARAFRERHTDVIYKSISGIRSRVSRMTSEHDDRFADVTACPVQFQEFIPGIDHRVHVVGDEVFGCRVLSDADDYRYPGDGEVEYLACRMPLEIEERCRALSAAMKLPFCGIDLRLTPEGEWVCFEVNPSPGFTSYEDTTGQPIAAAVARLLVTPTRQAPNSGD